MSRRLVFVLSERDDYLAGEIGLAGVVDGKIAHGDYGDVRTPARETVEQAVTAIEVERQADRNEAAEILLAGLGVDSIGELRRRLAESFVLDEVV